MIVRIVATVGIVIICFLATQILEQEFLPGRASDLAIEQIQENGAREQMRIEQNSQNWVNPAISIVGIAAVIFVWRKPVVKLYEKYK